MSAKITTPFGHAVPPAPRHSVTVHIPTWEAIQTFVANPPRFIASLKNVYPRMKPHKDIAEVSYIGFGVGLSRLIAICSLVQPY